MINESVANRVKKFLMDPMFSKIILNLIAEKQEIGKAVDFKCTELFTPEIVLTLLSQEDVDLVFLLLKILPESDLLVHREILFSCWNKTPLHARRYLTLALSRLFPDEMPTLIEQCWNEPSVASSENIMRFLLESLIVLDSEVGTALFLKFYPTIKQDAGLSDSLFPVLVHVANRLKLYSFLQELLVFQMNQSIHEEQLERWTKDFYARITGNFTWYYFCLDVMQGDLGFFLGEFPPSMVRNREVLPEIEKWLYWDIDGSDESPSQEMSALWEQARVQIKAKGLNELGEFEKQTILILLDKVKPDSEYHRVNAMVVLACALIINSLVSKVVEPGLSADILIREYVLTDLVSPPYLDSLIEELKKYPQEETAQILKKILDQEAADLTEQMKMNITYIVGGLGLYSFIETLVNWLDAEVDEKLGDAIHDNLLLLSGADLYVMNHWETLDATARVYTNAVIVHSEDSLAVKDFVLRWHDDEESIATEILCEIMQNHPDKDYLPLIKPRLYREGLEVEETVYYLGHYFDEDPQLLSKIHDDLLEHERNIKSFFASPFEDTADKPLPLKIDLNLECQVCHEVDSYCVDKILVTRGNDFFIKGDLACKKCGAYDDLEVTPRAYRKIQSFILKATLCRLNEDNTSNLFQFCDVRSQEGHISATEIFDYYRENLASEPNNPFYLLGFANVRASMDRYNAARPLYELVLKIEPGQPEAALKLAEFYKIQEKPTMALKLLEESLSHRSTWNFYRTQGDKTQFLKLFVSFYNSILPDDREKISLEAISSIKKIGRNDVCPCGSNKKYKKCCLSDG